MLRICKDVKNFTDVVCIEFDSKYLIRIRRKLKTLPIDSMRDDMMRFHSKTMETESQVILLKIR